MRGSPFCFIEFNNRWNSYSHLFTRDCTPLNTFVLVTSKKLIYRIKNVSYVKENKQKKKCKAKYLIYLGELHGATSALTIFLLCRAPALKRTKPTNQPTSQPASQSTMLSPVHESQLQCQRANPETGSKIYKDLLYLNVNHIYFKSTYLLHKT